GQDKIPAEGVEVWLLALANTMLEERLPRQPEVNFDILDDTLRNEATRTDVVRSLSDPQRDFLLCHVLKLDDSHAAKSLGITESAYKVRLSRARKKVGDYLAPRCEHVNPM